MFLRGDCPLVTQLRCDMLDAADSVLPGYHLSGCASSSTLTAMTTLSRRAGSQSLPDILDVSSRTVSRVR
jgi:hypothetical protein